MSVPSVDVVSFAAERDSGKDVFLLDVREPNEAATCSIDGAVLIPLGSLPNRVNEIPKDRPVVVQCHHGGRSARAVQYLLSQGFTDIRNLEGGIDQWSVLVDQGVPRY